MAGKTIATTKVGKAVEATAAAQSSAIVGDGLRAAGRPAAVALGLPVVGGVSHLLWGDSEALPAVITAMSASTTLLTAMVWRFTHDRGASTPEVLPVRAAGDGEDTPSRAERRLARRRARARRGFLRRTHLAVTTGATLGWLELATVSGPLAHPTVDLWLLGGFTGTIAWIIRNHVHGGEGAGESDTWGALWRRELAEQSQLAGTSWKTVEDAGPRVRAEVEWTPGEYTLASVQNAREHIAAAFDAPVSGVRVTPGTSARKALVTVVAGDLLGRPLPYPGPGALGGSVAEPLRVGRYEDWVDVELILPHQTVTGEDGTITPKISLHVLVVGMTGSGKSSTDRTIVAELLSRVDVAVWIADPVKQGQVFGRAAHALDWFAITEDDATAMLTCLPDVISARARWLGEHGYDNWEPDCGLSYLVVVFEEAASVLAADPKTFTRAAREARSAGVCLIPSLQRPTYDAMPTQARSQMSSVICHGVKDDKDAGYALEDLVDAGAAPHEWGAEKPGYAYLVAPGIPKERQLIPLRVYETTPDALQAAADASVRIRRPLDIVTATAAGPAYTARTRHTGPFIASTTTPGTAPAGGWTPAPTHDGHPVIDMDDDMTADPVFTAPPNPEPDLLDGIDIDSATLSAGTESGRLVFGDPATPKLPEMPLPEARAALDDALDQFEAARREFAPRDLRYVSVATGRNRDWLMRELRERVRAGRLTRLDDGAGNYRAHHAA